jgi:hypothetical protein
MDNKMYRLIWDETVRYEAFVDAPSMEQATEAWATGIEGQYMDSWRTQISVLDV